MSDCVTKVVIIFANLNEMFSPQVVEDPLQTQRLKYAFESEKGLLGTPCFVFNPIFRVTVALFQPHYRFVHNMVARLLCHLAT